MSEQKMTDREVSEYIRQEVIDAIEYTQMLSADFPLPSGSFTEKMEYIAAKLGFWMASVCFRLVAIVMTRPNAK